MLFFILLAGTLAEVFPAADRATKCGRPSRFKHAGHDTRARVYLRGSRKRDSGLALKERVAGKSHCRFRVLAEASSRLSFLWTGKFWDLVCVSSLLEVLEDNAAVGGRVLLSEGVPIASVCAMVKPFPSSYTVSFDAVNKVGEIVNAR